MKKIDRKYFESLEEKIRKKSSRKIHRVSGQSVKKIVQIIKNKKRQ